MIKGPSNRIIAVFLVTFSIVTIIIAISIYKDRSSREIELREETTVSLTVADSVKNDSTEQDTDQDGLRDWEEALWKTDPQNPDTDGDGTNDGEEVEAQRDPTVPGPDDEMSRVNERKRDILSNQSVYEDFQPGSITDILAQNLFTSYAGLKQSGGLGTTSESQALTNITSNVANQVTFIGPYTSVELSTFTRTDSDVLRAYGNNIGQAQFDLFFALGEVEEDDPSNPIGRAYKDHAARMMGISTPASQKDRHTAIANEYFILSQVMTNLTDYKKDPVKALLSIEQYQKSQENILALYSTIQTFMRNNDIIFDDTEPGALLWKI